MKLLSWIALFAVGSVASAGVIKRELKAQQEYTFETEFDRYEILCTATPQQPSLLLKGCTCTKYDERPYTGQWRYQLDQSALLSDGKTVKRLLANGLTTLDECHREQKEHFTEDCKVTEVK
ncbi:MAG: hypothetical protein R3B54_06220 [Bdellovibrionota bacterium]